MSTLNDDKIVLDEGRESLPESAAAPLRDQIVDKLYKKLDEQKIGPKVVEMVHMHSSNRTLWTERQLAWLNSWDQYLIGDTEGSFSGSSNLHIPMPFTVVKTMHARFMQAIWQDPPFNVKPQNEASTDNVTMVKDVLRWYLLRGANYNKGVGQVVDKWIWDWLTLGSGVMKLRWDVLYSRFIDVAMVQEDAGSVFKRAPDGSEIAIPQFKLVEKEVENVKKCFDGPVLELVDLQDLYIIGGEGNPDDADAVIQRTYMTASQLWTLVDRKIFKKDAVEAILKSGPDRKDGALDSQDKMERSENAGQSQLDTEYDLDRYEIYEAYLKVDVDKSGIDSDVIVWVHNKSKTLARATYLYRVTKSGQRPFAKIDYQPRKNSEYGAGLVEMLYPLSVEMDAIHNMRIDWGIISVMPYGFYRPTSGLDPKTIKLEPGALIPVDNPQTDVFFPNMGSRTIFGMQEEAAIQQIVERLTSVSDLNLGVLSGNQGATRTATGTRALVGEMSANVDVYLRRLNWGWEKALKYLLELLQLRIPPGLAFRLTGDGGADLFRTINSSKDIYGDFDIEVSPNSASSNTAIQEEKANEILQLVSNPLAIQLGIVTPANYYAAMENYLRTRGCKDYSKFIMKPQGPLRIFTPEEVANRLLRGIPVQVTPEQDLQGFISWFETIQQEDEMFGQFNEDQVVTLAQHAKACEQMLMALQEMQAQHANSQQMIRNSSQSQQQAPVGLNINSQG
jgi:hypothetical protein